MPSAASSAENANVPRYIQLPPPMFSAIGSTLTPDEPLESPLWSPALEAYHTAPSTPIVSPLVEVPPPATPQRAGPDQLQISIPPPADDVNVNEAFPTVEMSIDLVDDEGLTALEKIYLFARSPTVYHRLFIVHALPSMLEQVTPREALDFVLPLIPCLAIDEDERVKEALVAELVAIIWWFFTNCQVVLETDVEATVYSSATAMINVAAFTPTLGTLLLSPNSKVCGGARYAIVNLLSRMRKLDKPGFTLPSPPLAVSGSDSGSDEGDEEETIVVGLFGQEERLMFEHELLDQVVIGMGRLDVDDDVDSKSVTHDGSHDAALSVQQRPSAVAVATPEEQLPSTEYRDITPPELSRKSPVSSPVTSYFPTTLPEYSVPSPGSSNSSTPSSATDTSSSSSSAASTSARPSPNAESPRRTKPPSKAASPYSEAPPSPVAAPGTATSVSASPRQRTFFLSGSSDTGTDEHGTEATDEGEGDQAAMGRLSSMSLMAAVTASGCLDDDAKDSFVKEVQRVGQDPVYWVRREASYALGALAKVVPDEVVLMSLIPLFDTLRKDAQWHVRHSALFALPAILSRLKPAHRRKLAVDTIVPLSMDEAQLVRSGTLELLGEVLYTFHEDPSGPPEELVDLFLGRTEDKRVRDGQQAAEKRDEILGSLFGRPPQHPTPPVKTQSPLTAFYTDPARPLICAFNFPAVALALGPSRWGKLRQTYLDIAENPETAVRRSLAAGLGEMAKIIGSKNAEEDLMKLWWATVRAEEEDVRERVLGCLETFVAALELPARLTIVRGLVTIWQEGGFRGWRERKAVAKALVGLGTLMGSEDSQSLRDLLRYAMEDNVAAVREAAVAALPRVWSMFLGSADVLAQLRTDIERLARSEIYRHRMTFVACLESLLLGAPMNMAGDQLWELVPALSDDAVVGVRIGVARLARLALDRSSAHQQLVDLVRHLSLDDCSDVRAYAQGSSSSAGSVPRTARRPKFATFSRPPQPGREQVPETLRTINSDSSLTVSADHPEIVSVATSPAENVAGHRERERIVQVPA